MPWIFPALLLGSFLAGGFAGHAEEARPPEGVERPFAEPLRNHLGHALLDAPFAGPPP